MNPPRIRWGRHPLAAIAFGFRQTRGPTVASVFPSYSPHPSPLHPIEPPARQYVHGTTASPDRGKRRAGCRPRRHTSQRRQSISQMSDFGQKWASTLPPITIPNPEAGCLLPRLAENNFRPKAPHNPASECAARLLRLLRRPLLRDSQCIMLSDLIFRLSTGSGCPVHGRRSSREIAFRNVAGVERYRGVS